jgi:ribosomal protein S15P/S13E
LAQLGDAQDGRHLGVDATFGLRSRHYLEQSRIENRRPLCKRGRFRQPQRHRGPTETVSRASVISDNGKPKKAAARPGRNRTPKYAGVEASITSANAGVRHRESGAIARRAYRLAAAIRSHSRDHRDPSRLRFVLGQRQDLAAFLMNRRSRGRDSLNVKLLAASVETAA